MNNPKAKALKVILTLIISLTLAVFCSASSEDKSTFYYDNGKEITVINDSLSYPEKKLIADYYAYGLESTFPNRGETQINASILCTLFGHDLTTTYVSEVIHNVYTTSPKCVSNEYEFNYCTRSSCDYIESHQTSSIRISTCHG